MSLLSSPQSLDGLLRDLSDEELGEMDEEAMAPPGTPGVVQQEQLEKQPAASDQNDEGGATETISAKEAGADSQAETVGSNQSEPIEITGDVLRITLYGLASNDAYLTAGGEKKRGPTKSADISFNHEMCLKYATGISDLGALAARALEFRLPGVERVGMIQVTTVQKGKFEMASPWKYLPGSQPINVTFVKDAPADVRITLYFHGDQLFVERLRVAREAYQTFLTNAHAKLGRKLKAADIQVLFDHKADTIKNALGLKAGQPPKNCNVLEQIEGVVKRHMERATSQSCKSTSPPRRCATARRGRSPRSTPTWWGSKTAPSSASASTCRRTCRSSSMLGSTSGSPSSRTARSASR